MSSTNPLCPGQTAVSKTCLMSKICLRQMRIMEFELKEASSPVSKTTKSDLGVSMNLTDVDLIGTEMNAVGISLLVYHTVI